MPSWLIDTLLLEAAGFILAVTGCFVYGVRLGLKDWERERQIDEIAALDDKRLDDPYYCFYLHCYPRELVQAERERRGRDKPVSDTNEGAWELFARGLMTANETRDSIRRQMAATQYQINQAMGDATLNAIQYNCGVGNVSVIGSGNVVNVNDEREEERIYCDNVLHTVVRVPRTVRE